MAAENSKNKIYCNNCYILFVQVLKIFYIYVGSRDIHLGSIYLHHLGDE